MAKFSREKVFINVVYRQLIIVGKNICNQEQKVLIYIIYKKLLQTSYIKSQTQQEYGQKNMNKINVKEEVKI